jgi:hypothetical protein
MARFHRSRDGNSVIYEILEMGQQGEGTTTVEFLWDNSPAGGEAPIDIGLEVEFRMHRVDSLKFTSWRGVGRLSVATPPIE